jgi:hypothetical protein
MFEIKLSRNPKKNSPYVIDLKCDADDLYKLKKPKRSYARGDRQSLWLFFSFFKKIKIGLLRFGKIKLTIKPRHYHKNKIRQIILHLLAFILIAGILSLPFLTLWSYKNFSQSKGRILGETTSLIKELQDAQGLYQGLVKTKKRLQKIKSEVNQPKNLVKLATRFLPKARKYNHLLETGLDWVDYLLILLGEQRSQRYLLLFQNNLEMRPTGGFIGSLALIDIDQGEIKKTEVPSGGSYDLNYGLTQNILSPKPLRVINPQWEMQDCNWLPDFPSSAQKCAWFLEKSMGTSVDGVIAINLPIMVKLLKVLGKIEMPNYNIVIDDNNFISFTQTLVESKGARENGRPKQFLADLAPILISKLEQELQNSHQSLEIIKIIWDALETKDILLYSFDGETQSWIENNNWGGQLADAKTSFVASHQDYLHVNAATVNGGKSDFNIKQRINYQVDVGKDGTLVSTIEIIRGHIGQRLPADAQASQQEKDFNWLTTQPNLSYMRVYAPMGSKLLGVSGDIFDVSQIIKPIDKSSVPDKFLQQIVQNPMVMEPSNTRITQEFNKTVFGNYLKIDPGKTGHLIFKYQLPFKINDLPNNQYSLTIQKQPGIVSQFSSKFREEVLYEGELERDEIIDF